MSGISNDLKKIRGIVFGVDGVLSPAILPLDPNGGLKRMINVKDAFALKQALEKDLLLGIITWEESIDMLNYCELLGLSNVYINVKDKFKILKEWMNHMDLSPEEVAYMGDDIPDLECMLNVGLPCSPKDGSPEIRDTAIYISRYEGGHGCVRDLLEQVLRAQGKWLSSES